MTFEHRPVQEQAFTEKVSSKHHAYKEQMCRMLMQLPNGRAKMKMHMLSSK